MSDSSLILSTVGAAIGSAQLLELVKQSPYFNWFLSPATSERAKRVIGVLTAVIVALGIHYQWDATARTLAFTIPTTPELIHHAWTAFVQWSLQESAYKTVVKEK